MDDEQMPEASAQYWAQLICSRAAEHRVRAIISAIDEVSRLRLSNRGDVIVACTQVLAQCIVGSDHLIAAEVRDGIIAMIDGYAMQVALQDAP